MFFVNLKSKLSFLTNKGHNKNVISPQIVHINKTGEKNKVENYRPVENLCAATNIYERLSVQRIMEIEQEGDVDLIGNNQHGFKKQISSYKKIHVCNEK